MMEYPWGFNQNVYFEVMGGSAFYSFCSCTLSMSCSHYEKSFVYSGATILKANYCSSQ